MTREQADVALKFNLLCVCNGETDNTAFLKGKNVQLKEIHDIFDNISKDFAYSVTVRDDYNHLYTVTIDDIEVEGKFNKFIDTQIKRQKKAQLKELVTTLTENLKGKREINAFIGKLVDEIKTEQKG